MGSQQATRGRRYRDRVRRRRAMDGVGEETIGEDCLGEGAVVLRREVERGREEAIGSW